MQAKFLLIISLFVYCRSEAQQVFKGFDLNPSGDAFPQNMTNFNGKMYYTAFDAAHGSEIWVTDGTDSGSHLLKDINPGKDGSGYASYAGPDNYTVLNNMMLFSANDGVNGYELWVTDGTASGTQLFKDINTMQAASSNVAGYTYFSNKIYFQANDGTNGTELWVTDGTNGGTKMLKDINTDIQGSSAPGNFFVYNGLLYFSAMTSADGFELWVSDGSAAGTQMVKNINTKPGEGGDPKMIAEANGKLFFNANDGTNGYELWVSDGTTAGTNLVKDINVKAGVTSDLDYLTAYNGKLYFSANDDINGYELWVSDGTLAGTQMVKDITAGSIGSYPSYMTVFNGKLYFSASDGTNGSELWICDGTTVGTEMLKDVIAGVSSSEPSNFTVYRNKLYFISGFSYQLYCTDGTAAGTKNIAPPIAPNANPFIYVTTFNEYNNSLYFMANYNTNGVELWSLKDTSGASNIDRLNLATGFSVYPNPSEALFYLVYPESFVNGHITVTNLLGEMVHEQAAQGSINTIDLSGLANGLYFVKLMDGHQTLTTRKVVLQR